MPGLLKKIAKLFIYKEPKSKELGFELLETKSEAKAPEASVTGKNNSKNTGNDSGMQDDSSQGKGEGQTDGEAGLKKGQNQTSNEANSNNEQNQTSDKADTNNRQNQTGGKADLKNEQNEADDEKGISQSGRVSGRKTGKDQKGEVSAQTRFRKPLSPSAATQKRNEKRKTENKQENDFISADLATNLEIIKQRFLMPVNQDIILREFKIGRKKKAFIAYMDGMTDTQTLNLAILPKLMSRDACAEGEEPTADYLIESVLSIHGIKKAKSFNDITLQVLGGVSALFVDGCSECILMETRGYDKRNVDSPKTETVVRGSQEGFTEDLRTNVTLIRRLVKNENLVTEMILLGSANHENCAILYLNGVANDQVIQEVKKRLKSIKTDNIIGDGMIEQFIEDNTFMLFPQVISTERPDRTASFLMEGQVVIIGDGTPFALTVPVTFFRLFHTSEDTSVRWLTSNFLRAIRIFGLLSAAFLPGIYVAITLYHIEMIPTELLLSIARAKEQVPFPTIMEVLMMEIAFELIREGGIRVPSVIGQTLGIVGALILGQAAVSAGLVSPLLVIVVSITGLGSFAIPNYSLALSVRMVRFAFIFAGAVLGFYGLSLMGILLMALACSMKSFGVPYFSPIAPKTKDSKDVIFRHPIWSQNDNPDTLNTAGKEMKGKNKKLWISKGEQGEHNKEDQQSDQGR